MNDPTGRISSLLIAPPPGPQSGGAGRHCAVLRDAVSPPPWPSSFHVFVLSAHSCTVPSFDVL